MSKWKTTSEADHKVIGRITYRMTKPRARNAFVFSETEEDPWFISMYILERSSGKVKSRSLYIAKDVPGVIQYYQRQGWILEWVDPPLEKEARIPLPKK